MLRQGRASHVQWMPRPCTRTYQSDRSAWQGRAPSLSGRCVFRPPSSSSVLSGALTPHRTPISLRDLLLAIFPRPASPETHEHEDADPTLQDCLINPKPEGPLLLDLNPVFTFGSTPTMGSKLSVGKDTPFTRLWPVGGSTSHPCSASVPIRPQCTLSNGHCWLRPGTSYFNI